VCGIAGFLVRGEGFAAAELEPSVARMAETLRHRGPDSSGAWVDAAAGIALGHRRLAIVDLTPDGAQPMVSACGRFVITFNGEIYNFRELRRDLEAQGARFRGRSDTEVLLEAIARWGAEEALRRANGMLALAVWDRRDRVLGLARDRLGKKPLYWGRFGDGIFFASELKALRAHPRFRGEIDRDALAHLVRYSYVPAPASIFRGVHKLEPGTWLRIPAAPGAPLPAASAFWSAREAAERGARERFPGDVREAESALHDLLADAVERRMISDVPLGALLSGGIDSPTVVALMQQRSASPVRTFTIGFREKTFDEAAPARAVAAHLGTDHTELTVTPRDALEVIPRLPVLYDEPFADTSQIPTYLVARMARGYVTVALSGDGGDELFAGYRRYFRCLARWRWLARAPAGLRRGAARVLSGAAAAAWPLGAPAAVGRLGRVGEQLGAASLEDLFVRASARCPNVGRFVPGSASPDGLLHTPERWAELDEPLERMMYLDLAGNLPEDILTKVDRASMGVSLEVRCPLLDHRVVELAWRFPPDWKARGGEGKWILRRVLERYVPRALFDRPKQGFGVPLAAWLRGPLREWAEGLLDPQRLRGEGYLDASAVREVWSQHLAGWRDHRLLLWNLLSFEAWLDEFTRGS
jgi:asparagine synthase (glutamine-hydrolysing)